MNNLVNHLKYERPLVNGLWIPEIGQTIRYVVCAFLSISDCRFVGKK